MILHGQVVGLDADAVAIRNQPLDRGEVVVPHPVRVDQVSALAAPLASWPPSLLAEIVVKSSWVTTRP